MAGDPAARPGAPLSRPTLARLMRYYRFVSDRAVRSAVRTVTSEQIARGLDIDPTQVRKDFGAIRVRGLSRVGFDVQGVLRKTRSALGIDRAHEAVLVGAGRLGSALQAHSGFSEYGLDIVAAFDIDPRKVGQVLGGCRVRSMRGLKAFLARRAIRLAVLTTPPGVAQALCIRLVSGGVRAIWNFTPARLDVPPSIFVRNEDVYLSIGLSELAYHLEHGMRPIPPRRRKRARG